MIPSTEKMYAELTIHIEALRPQQLPVFQQATAIVTLINEMLEELKTKIRGYQFSEEAEEIRFYKEILPPVLLGVHLICRSVPGRIQQAHWQ
jgi:hypothetical protein